jgi:aminopeptidase N
MTRISLLVFILFGSLVATVDAKDLEPFPVEIVQYSITLRPDIPAKTVSGTTAIEFKTHPVPKAKKFARLTRITFPQNGLLVESASFQGRVIDFKIDAGKIVVDVPLRATSTPQRLRFQYRAETGVGLNFGPNYVYSAFSTCHWMICLEGSGDRAALRLEIIVPEKLTVIASGDLVAVTKWPGQQRRHVWSQRRPYAPYLFGFAAGEFAEALIETSTTQLRLLGIDETPGALRKKFQDSARMLKFLEAKAGIKLPHSTYTQVLVPGSAAQEASTFSLIGKTQLDPILDDPQEDWVILHEMAHQWWGNLVTCRDWSHFWLNEGLVVFMVAAYKEERWGTDAYQREMDLARKRLGVATEAKFDVPLAFDGEYPTLRIKRAITYSKGALFLDALRKKLGDDIFWRGIREYTQKNFGKTVTSRDFHIAMARASGVDLSPLFDEWVYPAP